MIGNNAVWMAHIKQHLEADFPAIAATGYEFTSPDTNEYNCVAWAAAADADRWWWPDPLYTEYWPDGVPREETLSAFIKAFSTVGYLLCADVDQSFEEGYEKIAIYTDSNNKPTHAARQLLEEEKWTSKIGPLEDISHNCLSGLEGNSPAYGRVKVIMRRKISK
jgi:hypothetical protein